MKKPRKIGNENVPLSWASVFLIRFVAAFPSRSLSITTASRYYQSWFGNVLFWNWSSAPIALVRVLILKTLAASTEKKQKSREMDNDLKWTIIQGIKTAIIVETREHFNFSTLENRQQWSPRLKTLQSIKTTFCGDDLKQIDFSRNPGSAKRTLYVAPKIELAPRRGRDTAIQDGHDTFAV